MAIKITAKTASNLVRPIGSAHYLIFSFTGEVDPQIKERVPLNLSLVIDRSGSMAGEKLELVKKAAAFVVDHLGEQDRVSVIAFDDEVQTLANSCQVTSGNRAMIKASIEKLNSGGSTNLSEGWLAGCREVAQFQEETNYVNCTWLLTDGVANVGIVDQEELANHSAELRKRGVNTTAFGVGLDFNEDLLRAMAEKGRGNFYFIESARQIQNYFEGELGERMKTVARGLALQIEVPGGFSSITCLNDYELSSGDNRATIYLGDLYAGEERTVVLKLHLPVGKVGQKITPNAFLLYTEAVSGEGSAVKIVGDLSFIYASNQDCNTQKIDPESAVIIGNLIAAKASQKILTANKKGQPAEAMRIVEGLRERLAKAGIIGYRSVQEKLNEVEALGREAQAAPMPAARLKEEHYFSHMAQRTRRDYKK